MTEYYRAHTDIGIYEAATCSKLASDMAEYNWDRDYPLHIERVSSVTDHGDFDVVDNVVEEIRARVEQEMADIRNEVPMPCNRS